MNDIEILEEYIKELNKNKKKHELAYSTGFGKYWSDFGKAIANLIQRNKDLEQIEKEHKEENGRLREENEVLRYGLRENKILRHGLEENTEEIDKLYKIINLMAEHIEKGCDFDNRIQTKQQILDYFTNKVEEDIKE